MFHYSSLLGWNKDGLPKAGYRRQSEMKAYFPVVHALVSRYAPTLPLTARSPERGHLPARRRRKKRSRAVRAKGPNASPPSEPQTWCLPTLPLTAMSTGRRHLPAAHQARGKFAVNGKLGQGDVSRGTRYGAENEVHFFTSAFAGTLDMQSETHPTVPCLGSLAWRPSDHQQSDNDDP